MGGKKQGHDEIAAIVKKLYDIDDSILEHMSYTVLHWKCLVPMCKCGTYVRDYGISPYFYNPRKGWGWVDGTDWWMMCGKHWKRRDQYIAAIAHRINEEYLLSHFQPK